MHRLALVVAMLSLSASAYAQLMPQTGQLYLVGSTEELFKIRGAIGELYCAQSLAHGFAGCPADWYSAPFDTTPCMQSWPETCTDGRLGDAPWKLGDGSVDCMDANYRGVASAWNNGWEMYLGLSVGVDVDPTNAVVEELVEIPALEDLVAVDDLPAICKEHILASSCGTHWLAPIEMCSWGVEYCCPRVDCGAVLADGAEYIDLVCSNYGACCPG